MRPVPHTDDALDDERRAEPHDGDHAHASHLLSERVALVESEHCGIDQIPPVQQFAEGEQHERMSLVVENGAGGDVADLFAERRNRMSPAFAGPVPQQLDHFGCVLVDLGGFEGDRHHEDVDDFDTRQRLLLAVHIAERVDEDGDDSCDIHRRYFLSVEE